MITPTEPELAWYCVRTKPCSEHVAAAHLRQSLEVETFCPRLRYHKATPRGKVLFHQAMFPCYLFVRFDIGTQLRAVTYARSVTGIVRFGNIIPPIDANLVEFLRAEVGPTESKYLPLSLEPGVEVEIASGPFRNLKAIVQYYMPAKDRVKVLLEVLGRETSVEVPASVLVSPDS